MQNLTQLMLGLMQVQGTYAFVIYDEVQKRVFAARYV